MHDNGRGRTADKASWMSVDLLDLREKGLSNDKLSKMTGIPVHIIDDQLAEIEEIRNSSGIF